jgi:hypothetical protein
MDPHKYKKIERRLQVLAADPKVAGMGKRIFGCPDATTPSIENSTAKSQRERDGRVLDFVALALALGAWWYTVVNPAPSFLFGSMLLFGVCFFALLALWGYFSWKNTGRIASAICFLLLFSVMDYSWYQRMKKVAATEVEKAQELDRKEAFQSLTAQMEYEIGDDPVLAAFSYSNGSSLPILVDEVEAESRGLLFGRYGRVSLNGNRFYVAKTGERLEPGGDGVADEFLQHFFAPSGHNIVNDTTGNRAAVSCADLLIQIDYRLESQPTLQQQKRFRLVTMPTFKGLKWVKENVENKTDFCSVQPIPNTK